MDKPPRIQGNPPPLSTTFTGRKDVLQALHAILHTALAPPRAVLQGPQHPDVAICYIWQGRMYHAQRDLPAAAAAFRNAWEIRECVLGPQHPDTIAARSWLAGAERELSEEAARP